MLTKKKDSLFFRTVRTNENFFGIKKYGIVFLKRMWYNRFAKEIQSVCIEVGRRNADVTDFIIVKRKAMYRLFCMAAIAKRNHRITQPKANALRIADCSEQTAM